MGILGGGINVISIPSNYFHWNGACGVTEASDIQSYFGSSYPSEFYIRSLRTGCIMRFVELHRHIDEDESELAYMEYIGSSGNITVRIYND